MAALAPLGYRGVAITVPYKVAMIPLLDAVDDDSATGVANSITIEGGRLIGHNNDGKGVVKAIDKVAPLKERNVVMLGCPVVDGVEMLVQLAMQIFQEWTGIQPEEAVFQRAVADALGEG